MNIITAMGDERLNILLRKEENFNVIGFDIQYQDAIFEILEENKNIDFLILNINLMGDLDYEELIDNINEKNKNIKLIIILEKENKKISNYLIKNNIKYIFNKDNFNYEKIINILNNKNVNLINKNNLFLNKIINEFNKNKKILNTIKFFINLKNGNIKIIKEKDYKINIIIDIKVNNKKNKINKKINLIKYIDNILNKNELKNEILKIIKEEI